MDAFARLMQSNPQLALAIMNGMASPTAALQYGTAGGVDPSLPGNDPSANAPLRGTPGMPQFSQPQPAVQRGPVDSTAYNLPWGEGIPMGDMRNLPMPTDAELFNKIKENVKKGVGKVADKITQPIAPEKLAALNASAGQVAPQTGNIDLVGKIKGGLADLGPSAEKLAALNAPAAAPAAPGNVNLADEISKTAAKMFPPGDPNAMSWAQKAGMMVGLGGGQGPGAAPIYQEMVADPMGNMTVAGTGNGLLGPAQPQTGFDPKWARPMKEGDDPNALTPALQPDPGQAQRFRPMPAANANARRAQAAPQPPAGQLNLSQANGGGTAPIPLPPNSADRPKPGPWGPNPTQAAWANGVQDGSWGAPDDRFVGAFANAAMPPQRGLLWPFSQ